MKTVLSTRRLFLLGAAALALTLTVSSDRVAASPEPDCGPNFEWICRVPGCPECPDVLFDGTVCEKNAFQKQTGRVCSLQ